MRRRTLGLVAAGAVAVLVAIGVALVLVRGDESSAPEPSAGAAGGYVTGGPTSEEEEPDIRDVLAEHYRQRSYPRETVAFAQATAARRSFDALPLRVPLAQGSRATSRLSLPASWRSVGPTVAEALPSPFTPGYAIRPSTVSGRVTSLLVGTRCAPGDCLLWVGTAGGGVFRTRDALATTPTWKSVSAGLTSSSIGFLARDPTDASGQTLYAGTGEPGSGADSEAGVGVFRSTNGGDSWSRLAGSETATGGAGVSGIVVDPRNPRTIYVSTSWSLHGSSSVVGGSAVPPGAPTYGLYRSEDGGETFSLLREGFVNAIALDPNDPDTLYAAVSGDGLLRRSQRLDGTTDLQKVLAFDGDEASEESVVAFALADTGSGLRIYAGVSNPFADDGRGLANLYRADDADKPAAELAKSWTLLSSQDPASTGYDSYRYCQGSCSYTNVIASPPGQPDTVWLGGQFDYDEVDDGLSAGRAVLRSTDAGVSFTDMTSDARNPTFQMHPDQHAIAFSPADPEVAFLGSDGGVVRTSGAYASAPAGRCASGTGPFVTACKRLLAKVPTRIDSLNAGLDTLQLQSASVSANPQVPAVLFGTQDNGTWTYTPGEGVKHVATGDGGQSGIDAEDQRIRFHTYYRAIVEINHASGAPDAWREIDEPLNDEKGEPREYVSFYMPIIADPRVGGSMFLGMQHVWRTQDSGGPGSGDWVTIGADLTSAEFGDDRRKNCDDKQLARWYCAVAAVERAQGDTGTLWAATFSGRVLVSKNADGPADAVTFTRIDVPRGTEGKRSTPGRFVSGIAIDPKDPNHAWISYSGYNAYTPEDEPGHVFEVQFDPATKAATWTNRSYGLEDQPITDLVHDPATGDQYGSTDFGIVRLPAGATAWTEAAAGLPVVAVYGLTLSPDGKTLYAATHGRGLWALDIG